VLAAASQRSVDAMQISPDFSLLGLALAVPLAVYLAAVSPLTGKRSYERLRRTRETDPKALTRTYVHWIGSSWFAAAVAAAAVLVSPGVTAADLGLTFPSEPGLAAGVLVAIVTVSVVAAAVTHRQFQAGKKIRGYERFAALLPSTPVERWLALGLSITAGICEEFVFRGLLIALGVDAGLGLYGAAVIAVVLFGAGHFYQGWNGVLITGFVGGAMTYLYLSTGSLLVPIVAHTLMDVRGLVLLPAPHPAGSAHPAEKSSTAV
jgi:uncharacterized protein